jgi:hypothetical protein
MKRLALAAISVGFASPAFAVPVVSDTDCPSAPAVQSELSELIPAVGSPAAEVRVRSTNRALLVELASEGEPLRSRELQKEGDCAARARASALIAAAWLDALPAQPIDAPEPPRVPAPPPAAVPAAKPVAVARSWLCLGVFGLADGWGTNAGVLGDVQFDGFGPVAAGLSLAVPLARRVDVGQGTATWWRPSAEITLRVPLGQGAWTVAPGLGAVVALLRVSGRGYDHDNTDTVSSWGARAHLRIQHQWASRRMWIEAGTRLWPFEQHVRNDVKAGETVARTLPRWDGQLAVGFSFAGP